MLVRSCTHRLRVQPARQITLQVPPPRVVHEAPPEAGRQSTPAKSFEAPSAPPLREHAEGVELPRARSGGDEDLHLPILRRDLALQRALSGRAHGDPTDVQFSQACAQIGGNG